MRRLAIMLAIGCAQGAAASPDLPRNAPDPKHRPIVLAPPAPEVRKPAEPVTLPTLPSFALPASDPGTHSPRALLVAGKKLLGTELAVKGYITWIYDCVAANARPGDKRGDVQRRIDADPTLCDRPKFFLGATKDTPPERSLWIVDVPRPPTQLERQRLPNDELAKWPAVPRIAVGDLVVVTGTFDVKSPHAEVNTDGLVVYKQLVPAAPSPAQPVPSPPPPPRPGS